jgi:muconate cycloisomerase
VIERRQPVASGAVPPVPARAPSMLHTAPSVSSDLQHDLVVRQVTSTIVDVPTVRRHKLSSTSVTAQNYVLVRLMLANGVEGIGEASTLGGPRWSEESVEAMKANIDTYLAPAIIGTRADHFEAAGIRMDQAAKRNNAAKAAVETALFDAVGKTLGLPASALLGGAVRDRIPVLWTLASGDPAQEVEEAERKLETRVHRTFKVKIGAEAPDADMARMRHLARALDGRAELIVDANQAWDETISGRCLPQLAEMGVRLVEQPVPAWNLGAMARLRACPRTPPLRADECVFDAHDMLAVAHAAAADAVSLKLVKHAGLIGVRKVAAVAQAAGIELYGGCLLESSIGASAHLQVFATLRDLTWGCEHFGPQILTDDLVTEPLRFENFNVHLPAGPGIGVVLDEDKLRRYARS